MFCKYESHDCFNHVDCINTNGEFECDTKKDIEATIVFDIECNDGSAVRDINADCQNTNGPLLSVDSK